MQIYSGTIHVLGNNLSINQSSHFHLHNFIYRILHPVELSCVRIQQIHTFKHLKYLPATSVCYESYLSTPRVKIFCPVSDTLPSLLLR